MTFPDQRFRDISIYADAYFEQYQAAAESVDRNILNEAANQLQQTHDAGGTIYVCGNGGSASISNHLVCDHSKGVSTDTGLRPRVHSLVNNMELLTAIANDFSYDDVFVYQLNLLGKSGDTLITISSSGDSENIVRALTWARENGLKTVAMTGFSGGRSATLTDINLHVASDNYGIIEDMHQSLMHLLAQYLRQAHMDADLIKSRKF